MSISVHHLSFAYGQRQVLQDVSLSVKPGELAVVLGPNGVGKSTLFRCMLGLIQPSGGRVLLQGQTVARMSPSRLARMIAYVPQSSYPAFKYSVFDMVLMGRTAHASPFAAPGKQDRAQVMRMLDKLGIADLAGRDYLRISGGERQLALIARALVQESSVVIMDEPTANLDYGNQIRVLSHVRALADEGYPIILSSHNPEQAYRYSDQIIAMKDGRIIAQGKPDAILTSSMIEQIYGIHMNVVSLDHDRTRVCIPDTDFNEQGDQAL